MRPIKECWDKTGRNPVTVKWVDADKRGLGESGIKIRLVARDLKAKTKIRVIHLLRLLLWRHWDCC